MIIVPGRPAVDALLWWVYLQGEAWPPQFRVNGADIATPPFVQPGAAMNDPIARRVFLVATVGHRPDSRYSLTALANGQPIATAASRTLPNQLEVGRAFTIGLGSCYAVARDRGLAKDHTPAPHRPDGDDPVRIRFLCGDQIYMDLSPQTGMPAAPDIPQPLFRYDAQWRDAKTSFAQFLAAAPTLVLADDHEYWNDYPHANVWLNWDKGGAGSPLAREMDEAFQVFQAGLNVPPADVVGGVVDLEHVRTFRLDVGGLSLFALDTRTRRNRYDDSWPGFAPRAWIDALGDWAAGLRAPGVLVVAQPLVEKPANAFQRRFHIMGDVNLPDYWETYAELCDIVFGCPHDILILSGDIHWSRMYQITRGERTVYEVISSPLARIPQPTPGIGAEDGKVEWKGEGRRGKANWLRRWAGVPPQTYATISFTPRAAGIGAPLRADVRWWAVNDDPNAGPTLFGKEQIGLA